jgi:hypothetical protein
MYMLHKLTKQSYKLETNLMNDEQHFTVSLQINYQTLGSQHFLRSKYSGSE